MFQNMFQLARVSQRSYALEITWFLVAILLISKSNSVFVQLSGWSKRPPCNWPNGSTVQYLIMKRHFDHEMLRGLNVKVDLLPLSVFLYIEKSKHMAIGICSHESCLEKCVRGCGSRHSRRVQISLSGVETF